MQLLAWEPNGDGPVSLLSDAGGNLHREVRPPGADVSDLPEQARTEIQNFWAEADENDTTRADRWQAVIAAEAAQRTASESVDLLSYANQKKWEKEVGGIVWNGITVPTDDRAKLLILGAAMTLADAETSPMVVAGVNYGMLTGTQFRALNAAVVAHVQATIATMAEVVADIAAQTITTAAEIDAAFAA